MKNTTHKKSMLLIAFIGALFFTSPAGAEICPSIADVYIDQYKPDENFNYDEATSTYITRILISYHPSKGVARGLFKYDIPEEIDASEIIAATLHLSGSYHTGGGLAINVGCYALNEPFDENTDTWNTLSGGNYDAGITSTGTLPAGNDWETSFDVTALVSGNLEKLRDNGMIMKLPNESGTSQYQNIASRECIDPQDFAPYIDIVLDSDHDGINDSEDNCPLTPNGPDLGICTAGTSTGTLCTAGGINVVECGTGGFCSMNQEDTYPPQGNNCGNACDCEGNFDDDFDADGTDAARFKTDFGRRNCTNDLTCNGDFECDADVDGTNASQFKKDFGRKNCPGCAAGAWCVY